MIGRTKLHYERDSIEKEIKFQEKNCQRAKEVYEKFKEKKRVGISWKGIWNAVYNVVFAGLFSRNNRLNMGSVYIFGNPPSNDSIKERIDRQALEIAHFYTQSDVY